MNTETKIYKINSLFARKNNIPVYFSALELIETPRAFYFLGRGTLETQKMGVCCVCGRALTHPVSVLLGIGPECGGHWWDWNKVGGYTMENLEKLKLVVLNMVVDQWVPKSCVQEILPSIEQLPIPIEHKMIKPKEDMQIPNKPKRTAVLVENQTTGERIIKIMFSFNTTDVTNVKAISGRRFHDEGSVKYWTAPILKDTIKNLVAWGFEVEQDLLDIIADKPKVEASQIKSITGLKLELFPYQKEGVARIDELNGRALLADEMGLGKTAQALAYLQLRTQIRPVIVVCPASLKLNWAKEAYMWMKKPNVQILSGSNTNVRLIGEIIIINYDILPSWIAVLAKIKPQMLILDEVHFIKTNAAKRTKAVKKLGKTIPHILALSGTPIENRPVELYNAMYLVDPYSMPPFWEYAQKFCNANRGPFGWDFSGSSNTDELHRLLTSTIMIRRRKTDVLKDLPDKLYALTPMELSNSVEYRKAEGDFIQYVKQTKGKDAAVKASNAEALAKIETLKQLAVAGKLDKAMDWINDFLDIDGKLVVFAVHKFVIDELMHVFGKLAVKIDGSTKNEDRQKAVDEFQTNPKIRLFVGNIKAAGVGITLTAASNVAFLELPWTPGALSQASDRVHRIGQKDSVTVHYLLAAETIEEKIALLLDKKRKVLDSVLDGMVTEEESLLSELINEYK